MLASIIICIIARARYASAGHCYAISSCDACIGSSTGSPCEWCDGACQMEWDTCAQNLVPRTGQCVAKVYPGEAFFQDFSSMLAYNPSQRNYGTSVTDIDADGQLEVVIAGFGVPNLAYKWDVASSQFINIASGQTNLEDASGQAIGLAACDVDGDGYEELYVLNTDAYSGTTQTSDLLLDRSTSTSSFVDLFGQGQNGGNYVAGRSCLCVDRSGDGRYGIMVANYGGPMKLFEVSDDGQISDAAISADIAKTTGGRALIGGPIISNRFDIFANNEGWSGRRLGTDSRRLSHRMNFFFVHEADGTYIDAASALGILDASYTGRGTALLDSNGDGLLDIVYGNWQGAHRLFIQREDAQGCVSFEDQATAELQVPSNIRTVIVADFDNDGYEEIFWNNIPGANRLFRKLPSDADWVQINIGDALESDGYGTGAAVGDFDNDGMLELFISHGESASQPVSYFRPKVGATNHWIRIAPRTSQGAPARGALVTLTMSSGRKQVRVIDPGSGYLCQQEPVAHFGIGTFTTVSDVTIQWPDGSQHSIQSPAVDTLHAIDKPTGLPILPAHEFSLVGNCLKRVKTATVAPTTPSAITTQEQTTTSVDGQSGQIEVMHNEYVSTSDGLVQLSVVDPVGAATSTSTTVSGPVAKAVSTTRSSCAVMFVFVSIFMIYSLA